MLKYQGLPALGAYRIKITYLQINGKDEQYCDDDTDTFTAVCRKEEGEEDDEHLNDTRDHDVVDVIVRFSLQIHRELDVDKRMWAASVFG